MGLGQPLTGNGPLRNGTLLYTSNGFAGAAVEEKYLTTLGRLKEALNAAGQIYECRLCRHVIVPKVVMGRLKRPANVAAFRIQRHPRASSEEQTSEIPALMHL